MASGYTVVRFRMDDATADALRATLGESLAPGNGNSTSSAQHPAIEIDRKLRKHLAARNRRDRTRLAAMTVTGIESWLLMRSAR